MESANTALTLTTSPHAATQHFSLFVGGVKKTTPFKSITLQQLYKRVKSNRYAAQTAAIRALRFDSPEQKALKLKLDNVTPAGVFSKRNNLGMVVRSGCVMLDYDKVRNTKGLDLVLRHDPVLGPSIMFSFISPRGGRKVLVAVDPTLPHDQCYAAVVDYITWKYPGLPKIDQSGKDVSRSCLLCHDPEAYLNPNHRTPITFPIKAGLADLFDSSRNPFPKSERTSYNTASLEPWIQAVEASTDFPDDYNSWFRIGFALATLGEGGREFFHRVSRMSPKYNEAECDRQFTLSLRNGTGAITVGTFKHICKEAGIRPDDDTTSDDGLEDQPTPCLPDDLFSRLPTLLRDCCDAFASPRERDVMLLGGLAVLSGCFPGVGGTYNRRDHGLNLFVFIIAPAASGKGTLAWARYLAQPWHTRLIADSKAARDQYDAQLAASKNKENPVPPPVGPTPRQQLYLPANTTAAAMLTQLEDNGGRGIICETEADTLSGALGADFGNFSDLLRKAFHHEPVSVLRKTDRQYIDIPRPALSIALTGTPDQVARLLKTAEDGLVSRNLFYTFTQNPAWRNVGPQAGPSLDEHFAPLAADMLQFIEACPQPSEDVPYPVQITFSADDWERLNKAGKAGLEEAHDAAGGVGASTAYRLGLIAWRIAGLLTVLRCYDNGEVPDGIIEAASVDITSALAIMDTVRAHALVVLASLSKTSPKSTNDHAVKAEKQAEVRRLRALPTSIRDIVKVTGVAKSTVQAWVS